MARRSGDRVHCHSRAHTKALKGLFDRAVYSDGKTLRLPFQKKADGSAQLLPVTHPTLTTGASTLGTNSAFRDPSRFLAHMPPRVEEDKGGEPRRRMSLTLVKSVDCRVWIDDQVGQKERNRLLAQKWTETSEEDKAKVLLSFMAQSDTSLPPSVVHKARSGQVDEAINDLVYKGSVRGALEASVPRMTWVWRNAVMIIVRKSLQPDNKGDEGDPTSDQKHKRAGEIHAQLWVSRNLKQGPEAEYCNMSTQFLLAEAQENPGLLTKYLPACPLFTGTMHTDPQRNNPSVAVFLSFRPEKIYWTACGSCFSPLCNHGQSTIASGVINIL